MEKLYKNWNHGSSIKLILGNSTWNIVIEWLGERCTFGKGWTEFVKGVDLHAGDMVEICHDPSVPSNVLTVCIRNRNDITDSICEGKEIIYITPSLFVTDTHNNTHYLFREWILQKIIFKLFSDESIEAHSLVCIIVA